MKKFMSVIMICLLLSATAGMVFAGNASKTGTAGGLELLLPVGARGVALGGAATSLIGGVEGIFYNPAGLSRDWEGSSVDALFSHSEWIATTSLDYAAVGVNLGDFGAMGFSLRSFSFGDIPETTEDLPDGTGSTFKPSYVTIGLTYAKSLTDRIHFGFTGKFISEKIMRTSATGFALDAGVIYYVGGTGSLRGLHFGVALKNIGPNMQYSGEDLQRYVIPPGSAPGAVEQPLTYTAQSFELPSSFELGVGYDYAFAQSHRFTALLKFNNMNFGNDQYQIGGEYAFKEMFFLRGGFNKIDGTQDNFVFGGTFGAGFAYNTGTFTVAVDYAYMVTQVFDGVNVLSVRLKL